jgi:hypothetical protein
MRVSTEGGDMKSVSRLLVIATVVLAAFGCRTSNRTTVAVDTCTGGYLGNVDATNRLVCVGTNGTNATPGYEYIHVYAKGRNGAPTQIAWASPDRNADLHIPMTGELQNCVKSIACPEKHACFATVLDTAPAGTRCEYQISNGTAARPTDPIIIIDTCCSY